MAKDLRLDVVSTSDGAGLISAAAELDRLAGKADEAGDQMRETAIDGGILAAELEAVKAKARELARTFDETGDRSLLRQISRMRSYEGQLKRAGAAMEDVAKDAAPDLARAGERAGESLLSGFADTLVSSGGRAAPLWMGVLSSPGTLGLAALAGVQIGGAVVAGIGAAGIGAGIAGALRDPQAKAALADLKSEVSGTLVDAAKPMVAPLSLALRTFGQDFRQEFGPGLKDTFADLAPEVLVLEKGIEGFLGAAVPGFEKAAKAAKPLLDDLGSEELPELGKSIADLFTTIADHAPEAEKGLKILFTEAEAGIKIIDAGIDVLSFLFDQSAKFTAGAETRIAELADGLDGIAKFLHLPTGALDVVVGKLDAGAASARAFAADMDGAKAPLDHMTDSQLAAANAAYEASQALQREKDKWDDLSKALSNEQAMDRALDAINDLSAAIKHNGNTIDQNTVKGRANREAYVEQVQTLKDMRDQLVKNGMSASEADKLFDGWIKQLDKSAEKAGLSSAKVGELNKQLGLIPKTKHVTLKVDIDAHGVGHIAGTRIKYYAAGGHYNAGEPRIVGEKGPEFDIPDHSGTIIPNSRLGSRADAGVPLSVGAGQPTVVELRAAPGDQVAQLLLAMLRPTIRGQFAGDVVAALGGHS